MKINSQSSLNIQLTDACRNGSAEEVKELIQDGADPNVGLEKMEHAPYLKYYTYNTHESATSGPIPEGHTEYCLQQEEPKDFRAREKKKEFEDWNTHIAREEQYRSKVEEARTSYWYKSQGIPSETSTQLFYQELTNREKAKKLNDSVFLAHLPETTPLHEAAKIGNLEVVQTLVEKGASIGTRCKETTLEHTHTTGSSPVAAALKNRNFEVVRYLEKNGQALTTEKVYMKSAHYLKNRYFLNKAEARQVGDEVFEGSGVWEQTSTVRELRDLGLSPSKKSITKAIQKAEDTTLIKANDKETWELVDEEALERNDLSAPVQRYIEAKEKKEELWDAYITLTSPDCLGRGSEEWLPYLEMHENSLKDQFSEQPEQIQEWVNATQEKVQEVKARKVENLKLLEAPPKKKGLLGWW